MNLLARDFQIHPAHSAAARVLGPLFAEVKSFSFPFVIGERNSRQFTFQFDQHFQARLEKLGARNARLDLPADENRKHDFAFAFGGEIVAVEVEKSNSDKILYDFMKFHLYLRHGATAAVLVVPRNWPHRHGEVDMFDKAVERYELCRQLGFGTAEFFDRCLIVGYEQAMEDGRRLTGVIRQELIEAAEA